jgi:membrane associated rhomboid family serine protease
MDSKKEFSINKAYPAILLALLIIVLFIVEKSVGIKLTYYGIVPRDVTGLLGIILGPMLHGDWLHLLSNVPSLVILMVIILYFYERSAIAIISLLWLSTGSAVWLFGKQNTFHIGASGIIYGMMTFIFFIGIFRGERNAMLISLMVLVLNSGLFAGFQPTEGVSWESHLFGAISGLVIAFVFKGVEQSSDAIDPNKIEIRNKYLAQDTFQYTKSERLQMLNDKIQDAEN